MNDITTDYEPYLRITEGKIWWMLMDAIRFGAGWLPIRDKRRSLVTELRAPDNYARDNVRTLLGAFRDDSLAIKRPKTREREGICFVEAEEFLAWLGQYITQEQATEITFPSELGHKVRLTKTKAAESCSPDDGQEFESLELTLEDWFDKKLNELPDELRQRVEQWFPGNTLWDELSVEQRRDGAHKRDYWHDPATEQERKDHWDFYERKRERLRELQKDIKKWESVPIPDPTNLEKQESRLKKLRLEKERLEQLDPCKKVEQPPEKSAQADPTLGNDRSDKKGGRQADDTGPTRPTGKDGEKPLVGREAIADHLKVSVSTIKNYMKTRAFPYHKPAGTIQAYPSELDTWSNRPRKKK